MSTTGTPHAMTGMAEFIKVASHGEPELALLAAMVRVAFEQASEGDEGARAWLASEHCAACLGVFVEADPALIQAALVAKLPRTYQVKLALAAA